MTLVELIVLLVIAAVCGAVGQAIAGYSLGGFLVSTGVGFIGAFLGGWIARSFGLPHVFDVRVGTTVFPVVWSIVGSVLFVAVISLLTRARYRSYGRRSYS